MHLKKRARKLFATKSPRGRGALPLLLVASTYSLMGGVLGGCEPTVAQDPKVEGGHSLFDPATGNIPLPNDILKDPKTHLISLPIAKGVDSPLTEEVKQSINRLDGWLTASTITIPFDSELDGSTLTSDTVALFDLTRAAESPPVVTKVDPNSYYLLFNIAREPATKAPYTLTLKNKAASAGALPADFPQGHRYAVVVTDGVKDKSGHTVIEAAAFFLLKSKAPLANSAGKSLTILPDADAVGLEMARHDLFQPVFDLLEMSKLASREHAIAFSAFSIESGPRAVFDPILGTGVPTPTDSNAAPDVRPSITFDLPLDQATVNSGVHLYKVAGTALTDVAVTGQAADAPDASGRYALTLNPGSSLDLNTKYLVVLTDSIKGKNKVSTEAFSFFSLLRNTNPLIDSSTTPPKLNSPFLDTTLDILILNGKDPKTAAKTDWDAAYEFSTVTLGQLETLRTANKPYFDALVSKGIERLSVTALWAFTTRAQ